AEIGLATRAVTSVLWLFSALTAIVVVFLLYNAVSSSVAQRGREIALLRALGVRRAETTRLVLAEAAAIGLLGAPLGLLLSFPAAALLVQPMRDATRTALSLDFAAAGLEPVGVATLGAAVALGLAIA